MKTERTPERLVFFADAVVAIALTLLVLPLTEVVPEIVAAHGHSIDAITENQWRISSFLLSFVVIARLWLVHHRLFEVVASYTVPLQWLNIAWLLTVAVLPFPTEMIGAFGDDRFTELFYIGTVFASSLCLTAMTLVVRADPQLVKHPGAITDSWRFSSVGSTVALGCAFALTAFVPGVDYYSILLLVVPAQLDRIRYRRRAHEDA
ncbi:DUF1211 domain-containing protein [Amycolatopsis acidiphila]|uniref:DUF1211 domain-containing protein n=1 Tax=Amycolatopsis acidiphila TaxID=715473 RepID=A0A558ADB0_9PSEU|nr:TMEM175 family protein [Amycolatopsis acidiphila]TVT22252.1 DUF1211 domain-containing protein [Amycolatopsis acidiphila]UIJ58038.1 DUF1211 domain-containing protein [Amycolatopsis acidiphila]GHG70470.1 DUF1211 domain-containing membrane protein [Amycolatopsis acidiphila]